MQFQGSKIFPTLLVVFTRVGYFLGTFLLDTRNRLLRLTTLGRLREVKSLLRTVLFIFTQPRLLIFDLQIELAQLLFQVVGFTRGSSIHSFVDFVTSTC